MKTNETLEEKVIDRPSNANLDGAENQIVGDNRDAHTSDLASAFWDWNDCVQSATHELLLLRWEGALQRQLGTLVERVLRQLPLNAAQNVVVSVLLSALASAVALPAVMLKATDVIDGTWTIATIRAG